MPSEFSWPQEQCELSRHELKAREESCKAEYLSACADMRIDADLLPYLRGMYIPLAAWLERRQSEMGSPLVVGLTGGQGSGKSTTSELLNVVFRHAFGKTTASLSIDDFYKTHEERQQLACEVHELFVTRGVPGTHDSVLGAETLERLLRLGPGESMAVPAFDKATDDRRPESEWPTYGGALDIIIFEGWCVGALPQTEEALREPINALEQGEDREAIWRTAANSALRDEYQRLFTHIDIQILLQVDSMKRVFEWRQLQEHKLRRKSKEKSASGKSLRLMSDSEVNRFIMHYERLTRHILDEMPQRADIVFPLRGTHNATEVRFN